MSSSRPLITLEQLAGISAALAEKLPLATILEQEQVDEAAFRAGEIYWRQQIAESVATQLEYTSKLRVAEDCLARKLIPISDDPAAWVGLLGELATTTDQDALLAKLGITMNDVGRLGRTWKERVKKDPAMASRLSELAKTAGPPETVTAGPVELRPFPWTPPPKPKQARSAEPQPVVPLPDVSRLEALPVQRHLASFQMANAAKSHPELEQPQAPLPAEHINAPVYHSAGDPMAAFAAWSVERYAKLVHQLRSNPAEAETILRAAGLTTAESRRLLHEHFHTRFERESGLRAQYEATVAKLSTRADEARAAPSQLATTTTEEVDVSQIRGHAMPFAKAAVVPVDSTRKREQAVADQRLAAKQKTTIDPIVLARMRAAFGRQGPGDAKMTETAHVDDAALKPALPFSPGESAEPLQERQQHDTHHGPSSMGATVIVEDTPAAGPLGWSFERYCLFCIEIQTSGLTEEAALAKENVTRHDRQLLDAYWQPKVAADPALRLAWLRLANQRGTNKGG